jgi:hypothetical protein
MNGSLSWRRLEAIGVVLVSLHSLMVGAMLFFIPAWTLKFAGWDQVDTLFFPRQSGAFHFVVAAGYFVEWRRCQSVNLLLMAKATAVIFLLVLSPWQEAWSVPFSGIMDGLMLVGMFVVHRLAVRERTRAEALG